jgi:hypothetical protein
MPRRSHEVTAPRTPVHIRGVLTVATKVKGLALAQHQALSSARNHELERRYALSVRL